ncbi:hypothetical protein BEWA_029410 [Theileria equi strain WA]|uniref:Signal peptide containing protein n=1 Tax=Theileria equi strain WA TaxID=1537102 RepID=L0AYJ8_THEEQ|nr:hypothetical protein BEWA_029410 [Theileria equi strain WA]AFZ80091.1 hypothetical protein BEWA_029410 [Theileria equi strain WA]|eukprot:XP_004829757.1 hypothetical protein BEWA_029410 [Theileria equi strain WA]
MRLSSLLYTIFIIKLVRSEKKVTFNVSQPDLNNTTLETRQDSGIEVKTYSPRDGFRIESVKYGDKELWSSSSSGQEACKSIQFHSKGETKLIALWIVNDNNTLDIKRFNKVGTEWKPLELEDFNDKIREAKGQEAGSNEGTRPTPVADYKSKIDSAIFNVRVSSHNGVPLLTCTPKDKKKPTQLVYGGETIWDGGEEALFLSALIYFKGDKPCVVTLSKKENGKDHTLFLHKDETGKWVNDKNKHAEKLKELQDAARPKEPPETAKGHVE